MDEDVNCVSDSSRLRRFTRHQVLAWWHAMCRQHSTVCLLSSGASHCVTVRHCFHGRTDVTTAALAQGDAFLQFSCPMVQHELCYAARNAPRGI